MQNKLSKKISRNLDIVFINRVIKIYLKNIKKTDSNGNTLLILASGNGYLEMVKLLIEMGININAVNNDGTTALQIAEENGYNKIVEYLIKQGADITINNLDFSCS